jgi:hypothetical protein
MSLAVFFTYRASAISLQNFNGEVPVPDPCSEVVCEQTQATGQIHAPAVSFQQKFLRLAETFLVQVANGKNYFRLEDLSPNWWSICP